MFIIMRNFNICKFVIYSLIINKYSHFTYYLILFCDFLFIFLSWILKIVQKFLSDTSKLVCPNGKFLLSVAHIKTIGVILYFLYFSHIPHTVFQELLLALTSKYVHNLTTTMNLVQTIICLDSCKSCLTFLFTFTHLLTVYSQHNNQRNYFLRN